MVKIISRNFANASVKMQKTHNRSRRLVPAEILIKRSRKRKKTIQGFVKDGVITVHVPFGLDPSEEKTQVEAIAKRLERKMARKHEKDDEYLLKLFEKFNREFFDSRLVANSIRFVNNQNVINGSCTPGEKTIRISDRLLHMPSWVLNYVVIHEMTHLVFPDHSRAFWNIVNRYRYTERARGYLIAKGMEND